MDVALLVARIALALVFAVAGLAKLADRAESQKAIVDFGLPAALAGPLGVFLPLAELAVAVALIPTSTAWWGAVGGLALLLLFIAGIGVNLAQGRKPNCHCFGQIYSSPAGWSTLIRNGVLAAIAGFIVWGGRADPGPGVAGGLDGLTTAGQLGLVGGAIMSAILTAIGWVVLNLVRQNGRLLLRLEALESRLDATGVAPEQAQVGAPAAPEPGLPIGTPAPNFSLSGLHGETLTLGALLAAGKQVMLIFSDPNCGPCNSLLPDIGRWQSEHSGKLTIALISRGASEANRAKSAEHGLTHVLLQQDNEIADAYQVLGTPSAVIVAAGGTISSPLAAGADSIRALLARTVGTSAPATVPTPAAPAVPAQAVPSQNASANGSVDTAAAPKTLSIGDPAPTIKLPDLKGKTVNLAGFRGVKTAVLFWNPGCGYCKQMLDDLRAWEAKPPKGSPKILIVSTGTFEANRSMRLHSPVVLDPGFSAGTAFGATGTPSAVLVDENLKVASPVVPGAQAVLSLLGVQQAPQPQESAPAQESAKLGDPAPKFSLPDLSGRLVSLDDLRGRNTLLLFWNPGCGFCRRMVDDLKAWENSAPASAPKTVVISTGTVEANQALGLRSPVLLDQGMSVGSRFGANGTPMAVLLDEKGNIASELAVGAQAVLDLARGEQDDAKTGVA